MSSALNLAKKGFSVALCEARTIGWGASGRNGGQLGIGMRKEQSLIEKKLGFEYAKELWLLGLEAVSETTKLISDYNIQCALQKGIIYAGFSNKNSKSAEARSAKPTFWYPGTRFCPREASCTV